MFGKSGGRKEVVRWRVDLFWDLLQTQTLASQIDLLYSMWGIMQLFSLDDEVFSGLPTAESVNARVVWLVRIY